MDWHILDQEAPGISDRLLSLNSTARHRIALKCASFAAGTLRESDDQVRSVIQDLEKQVTPTTDAIKVIIEVADLADETYLELQQAGKPEREWIQYFQKARLLHGIAVAFREPNATSDDLVNAVYEFRHCAADPKSFLEYVESEIRML